MATIRRGDPVPERDRLRLDVRWYALLTDEPVAPLLCAVDQQVVATRQVRLVVRLAVGQRQLATGDVGTAEPGKRQFGIDLAGLRERERQALVTVSALI